MNSIKSNIFNKKISSIVTPLKGFESNQEAIFHYLNEFKSKSLQKTNISDVKRIRNRKRKIPKFCVPNEKKNKNWISFVSRFLRESSLHGLHFLAEREKRSVLEIMLWVMILCIVYVYCGFLIKNSVGNYLAAPVVISLENKPSQIALSPFPAITICDSSQIKINVFNISNYLLSREYLKKNINYSHLNELDYANILCQRDVLDPDFNTQFLNLLIFRSMMKKSHKKCEEIFSFIKWTNETLDEPCDYFQPFLTELGLCFSFNMMPLKVLLRDFYYNELQSYGMSTFDRGWASKTYSDWYPQFGYFKKKIKFSDIPRRTSGAGSVHRLIITMKSIPELDDASCSLGNEGYQVLVHNPADVPISINTKVMVTAGSQNSLSVMPHIVKTSKNILSWMPSQRGCYKDGERHLSFYKIYTQTNCYVECEANYSLSECGCVAFYQPRSFGTPICGSVNMDCVEDALIRFSELLDSDEFHCGCLPACFNLQYQTWVTSSKSMRQFSSEEQGNFTSTTTSTNNGTTQSNVDGSSKTMTFAVNYESRETLAVERRALFTFPDFIGNVGGILGLFLGFSIISLVEIAYYLVIRPTLRNRPDFLH